MLPWDKEQLPGAMEFGK